MLLVSDVPVVYPSPLVLATLGVILGASVWVFATLVRRETRHRRAFALAEWARSRNMRVEEGAMDLPDLGPFKQLSPVVRSAIRGEKLMLAQIETGETALNIGNISSRRWNLIIRNVDANWPATALRPTSHSSSAVDCFSLSSYPSLMPTDRFMIFGTESRAAKALAESSAPALLPHDVGLIVYGGYLILDFSGRPFDEIEFGRLIDLTEQLAPRLSPPPRE